MPPTGPKHCTLSVYAMHLPSTSNAPVLSALHPGSSLPLLNFNKGQALSSQQISKWVLGCIHECYKQAGIPLPDRVMAYSTRAQATILASVGCVQACSYQAVHSFVHDALSHRPSGSYGHGSGPGCAANRTSLHPSDHCWCVTHMWNTHRAITRRRKLLTCN